MKARISCKVMFCAAVLSAAAHAQTVTFFANFGAPLGNPSALVQAIDGNFYGTSRSGGPFNAGTIYSVSPAGVLQTVASFTHDDGEAPNGLIQSADGNLYGTAAAGGVHEQGGYGTIFKMRPNERLKQLLAFNQTDGARPLANLMEDANGRLYGSTYLNGEFGRGTIFTVSPKGALTTIYNFPQGGGSHPGAVLLQGANGNLYGTTVRGGPDHDGTIFEITPKGSLTILHTFNGKDGRYPQGSLAQDEHGNLYGTTYGGGFNGTLFKLSPDGKLSTLYTAASFNVPGGVIRGSDGNLYGVTLGTIFQISPTGTITTLYSFAGSGSGPLVQGTDGNFYGATENGVYRLSLGLAPFVKTQPAAGKVGKRITILGTNLTGATSVTFHGTAAEFTVNASGSAISATVPAGATTGAVEVTLPGGGMLSSNAVFHVRQ